MATWGELDHLFDLPKHEDPAFREPWKHIESMKSVDDHFTNLFAQLYLKENLDQEPPESSSPSLFTLSPSSSISSQEGLDKKLHRRSDSASSFNSENSSVFESSDDAEKDDEEEICATNNHHHHHHHHARTESSLKRSMRSNSNYGAFPPPISCIGRSGKPWVSFQSIRQNGRFILTEVRIPTQEFMHACRENGRLKLHFIHSESEEEEEEEDEGEEETAENGNREAMEA